MACGSATSLRLAPRGAILFVFHLNVCYVSFFRKGFSDRDVEMYGWDIMRIGNKDATGDAVVNVVWW